MRSGHIGSESSGRLAFVSIVASLAWFGDEFTDEMAPLWFQKTIAGVPLQYFVFAAVASAGLAISSHGRPFPMTQRLRELGLWRWVVLIWVTLAVAITLAIANGVSELFADWRNWLVLAGTAIVAARYLADKPWRRFVISDVAIAWGMLSIPLLVDWTLGGGWSLFDVRIPLFNGYNLVLAGLAAFVGLERWLSGWGGAPLWYRNASLISSIAGALLIILSFRRSYWAFLLAGILVVLGDVVYRRRLRFDRTIVLTIAGAVIALAAFMTFGAESLGARLVSFLPSTENEYSATNEDHVNDLVDAMDVIAREPILGLGIGQYYETSRIATWKSESFEVHNALLQVWLKFGLLGVVTYIGFHVALIRAFWLRRRSQLGYVGVVAFLIGLQVEALAQTWPYQSFKLSIAHGLLVAVLAVNVIPNTRRSDPAVGLVGSIDAGGGMVTKSDASA